MITKRLIYHFYIADDFTTEHPIYKIHQYLLKKYSNIFDEATFIISSNDNTNEEKLKQAKIFLLDCNFKNIEFRNEENNALYEVSTFDKYILKKLNVLDGMTFFGHIKGINNINEQNKDKDAVFRWIFALYYLSLEFYKEGEKKMFSTNEDACFFGGLLAKYKEHERNDKHFPKNNVMYIGTYYWLNCKQIYSTHKDELPYVYNRFYAENFPGMICHPYNFELYSHNYMILPDTLTENLSIFSSIENFDRYINCLLTVEEKEEFYNEYNKMVKELNI